MSKAKPRSGDPPIVEDVAFPPEMVARAACEIANGALHLNRGDPGAIAVAKAASWRGSANTVVRTLSMSAIPPVWPADQLSPRLTVDIDRRTITFDGIAHDVGSEMALRWVRVLASQPGVWISGRELAVHDSELQDVRSDRLLASLPKPVRDLIDSKTGCGSRIRL